MNTPEPSRFHESREEFLDREEVLALLPYEALANAIAKRRTLTDDELDDLLLVQPDHEMRERMAVGLYDRSLITREMFVAAERRWTGGGEA